MIMRKFFYLIPFLLFCFSTIGMEQDQNIHNNKIKIGIELELQGIEYDDLETVAPDHLRLFESAQKTDGRNPDWYLEVDGTGNLEFVSNSFLIKNENFKSSILYSSIQQMHKLLEFILTSSNIKRHQEENSKIEKVYGVFEIKKGTPFQDIGQWMLSPGEGYASPKEMEALQTKKDIKIIIKDPTCRVRPQATFEFPLDLVKQFTAYMAKGHPKLKIINKNILKENPKNGLLYLIDLYIESLNDKNKYGEAGPKEKLPLMSRKSFSSMYASLKKEIDLNEIFKEKLKNKLFGLPYFIIFNEQDLSEKNEIYSTEIKKITIEDWINSIKNPIYGKERRKNYKEFWLDLLKTKKGKDDEFELLTYQINTLGLYDRMADILSPPPFLDNNYSMGKYDDSNNQTAIIEMRGYTKTYGQNMRMGPLTLLWLQREIYNAFYSWNPKKELKIDNYDEYYENVNEEIGQTSWYEEDLNIRKIIQLFNETEEKLIEYKNVLNKLKVDTKILGILNEDRKPFNESIVNLNLKIESDKIKWALGHLKK